MVCLKKHRELLSELADRFSLPEEVIDGAAKITVTAGRRVLIENHRGIQEYGPERIVVCTQEGKLILSGAAMGIRGMDRHDLLIGGKMLHAEWE